MALQSVISRKREVHSKLNALDALKNKVSKVSNKVNSGKEKFNSSISSINNETNSTDFLVDLAQILAGAKVLKDYVVDTIVYRLPEIEQAIKDGLKESINEVVSCDLDATIPDWFKNGAAGVELKVTDIDFYDIMKTDPETFEGGLIYTDVSNKLNSSDFNTYLYYTIQKKPSGPTTWQSPGGGAKLVETNFKETTTTQNNVVNFTASADYSNKSIKQFNNDFIDSLSLFGNPFDLNSTKVVSLIMEELFGTVSSSVGKSKKQINLELQIKQVLDCILDSEDDNITDNFFTFDNPTLARIDRETNNRANGIREVETCGNLKVQVTGEVLNEAMTSINDTLGKPNQKAEEAKAVKESLDNLATIQASFSINETDKETIKSNFFIEIIKKLQRVIMSAISTPEFTTLFAINHQIQYGKGETYDGPIDFFKKQRVLIRKVGAVVLDVLLTILLDIVLFYLTLRLKEKFVDDEIERNKNYIIKLLSLLGVPPSVTSLIRKVNTSPTPSNLNIF